MTAPSPPMAAGEPRLALPEEARRLGVYVHYPYCVRRCPYCDFTVTTRPVGADDYRDGVLKELALRAEVYAGRPPVTSIYFGGGTPGLWAAPAIGAVIDAVAQRLGLVADAEITVECNPGERPPQGYAGLKAAGVNRISLGAQSFDDRALTALGRSHCAQDIHTAVDEIRAAGIEGLSIDLIYGFAGQRDADLVADAQAALALDPPHISTYQLTVEPKTVFGLRAAQGKNPAAGDDRQAELDALMRATLEAGGLPYYEVSNAAKPGFEAVHNSLYWAYAEYMGLGVGAHGLRHLPAGAERTENLKQISRWQAALAEGWLGQEAPIQIDLEGVAEERVLVGLRRREGVPADDTLRSRFGAQAAQLVARGWLIDEGGRWRTTAAGLQVLNRLILDLVTP